MQPAPPTNRRVSGKSYKPETDNTRKSKFSRNKTSTYPAHKGGLSPFGSQLLEFMLVKNRDYRVASWKDVFQMCRDVESGVKFKPRNSFCANSSLKLMPAAPTTSAPHPPA